MTDFDARLRRRLERLDAAIPTTPWTHEADTTRRRVSQRQSRSRPRRRLVVLLAAAAVVLATGAVGAQRVIYPDVPEPQLESAIAAIWTGRDCVPPAEARAAIQQEFDALGYGDWTISDRPGTDDSSCASAAVLSSLHQVQVMPGISMDIQRATDVIADGLLSECMGRADATQYVTSVLTTAGSGPFVVRADPWGPQGGPGDKIEQYRAHVDAGCFVYVGMATRDDQGRAEHHLWGPFP